jgi:hypothetical protein
MPHPRFVGLSTGDESWFLSEYLEFGLSGASRDPVVEKVKTKNDAEKGIISLIWDVAGINNLIVRDKGMKYQPQFLCQQFISDLKSKTAQERVEELWKATESTSVGTCPYQSIVQ